MVVAEWKKEHEHEECACVWQHSHAQHRNELSRIKLDFNKTRFTMRQTHVCKKGIRSVSSLGNLLTVQSLKQSDKIKKREKLTKSIGM